MTEDPYTDFVRLWTAIGITRAISVAKKIPLKYLGGLAEPGSDPADLALFYSRVKAVHDGEYRRTRADTARMKIK